MFHHISDPYDMHPPPPSPDHLLPGCQLWGGCGRVHCSVSLATVLSVCMRLFGPHSPSPPLPLPLPLPSACRRIIQDASVRGKYRYLITNSFVQANRTLKWCPSPGCGNAVMATDREEQGVRCHCGKDFW